SLDDQMMGSRVNDKGKAPVSCSPLIEENKDAANGFSFLDGDLFDSFADIFQNSQDNPSPDFDNLNWNSQCLNLGQIAISAGLMNDGPGVGNLDNLGSSNTPTIGRNLVGESNIGSVNRPQVNLDIGDIGGSSSQFHRRDSTPVHTRYRVDLNSGQYGIQGKDEGSFLSLGNWRNEEATLGINQHSIRDSDNLKESALADGGIFNQSNQFSHMDRMTPTNSSRSNPYQILQMQQNDMQNVIPRNISSGNLDQYRSIVGNQAGYSGTMGGNSAPFINCQQLNMINVAPELAMPSWVNSYRHGQVQGSLLGNDVSSFALGLRSGSIPADYAGQLSSQRAMSMRTQDLFSLRTMAPQVGWATSTGNVNKPENIFMAIRSDWWSTSPNTTPKLSGYKCLLCKRDLALTSEGAVFQPAIPPPVAVLPCGHIFHDQCLENITPDQEKDPTCIPCALVKISLDGALKGYMIN
ncbi:zinc finger, RING/FYVE/PHD-type containing protein, partial [Tanacetum coccineum]